MSELNTVNYILMDIWHQLSENLIFFIWLAPLILLYEMPLWFLVISGIMRFYYTTFLTVPKQSLYLPKISCVITCYSEGKAVITTIDSLVAQTYEGEIEIIAVIDGAIQNAPTYQVTKSAANTCNTPNRNIIVLPKWQRGGRVSALNAGLHTATGEIVINVDADTSFDNDMVTQIVPHFENPDVPAVGGALRVRNVTESIFTRMQAIEYLISMQGGKTGLGQWNLLNNISGAFGAFRRDFLIQIGGWDTHTAEDLDLTLRIKQYFERHPTWRIPFATLAIGHTDAPADFKTLLLQRLRWDGDLFFMYFRKHWPAFSPKLLGSGTFIFTLLYGFLQTVLIPIVVIIYSIGIALNYPWQFSLSISIIIYVFYFVILMFFYLIVLLAISERPKHDLKLILWLPFYPLYSVLMRLVSFFALLNEVLRRSHEESTMAPWWVLKRGRKF